MVAHALHNGSCAGVAHAEALTGYAVDERRAARSTVQCHVADDDVLAAVKGGVFRRVDDELAAGQTLADVVIRVADQLERQALGDERAEALAAVAVADDMERVVGQRVAEPGGDLAANDRAERAVRSF
jgi:hypothetical protein